MASIPAVLSASPKPAASEDGVDYCAKCDPKEMELPIAQAEHNIVGIRGWLILPAIGLVLSLITIPIGLIAGLAGEDIRVYPAYEAFSLLVNSGFYIFVWVAAIECFKKRTTAPLTMIQLMVARVVASALPFVLGLCVVGGGDELITIALLRSNNFIGAGIAAAIWIPYWKRSKRVKATFTN